MLLQDILKDSDYQQSQFNLVQIAEFEKRIIVKTDKNKKEILFYHCKNPNYFEEICKKIGGKYEKLP